MASLRLVHLLRRYAKRLTVIAPLNCASAATMLALGADTIQMGPLSYLTAVDTSLEHDLSPLDHTNQLVPVSNDEVDRVIRLWKETVGRRGDGGQPLPGALQVPPPARDRRARPGEQPVADAVPRDPRLPHAATAARPSASRAGSTPPTPPTSTRSRAARRAASASSVQDIPGDLDRLLQELNLLYSEMGQRAITDYDEENHHDNEITNILEGRGAQVFYQVEKDWHYRKEERRWVRDERRLLLVPLPHARRPHGEGQAAYPLVPRRPSCAPRDFLAISLSVVRCSFP